MKFDALVLPLLQKRLYKASFWIYLIFLKFEVSCKDFVKDVSFTGYTDETHFE
jgi:hypothetical protein